MSKPTDHEAAGRSDEFPTATTDLPESVRPELVHLADGEVFDLRIAPVSKRLGDAIVRMLAYNGSIPGPTLGVHQGSEIVVNVANHGDLETTVHWHGVRLDNRYDGTHQTQAPIPVGGTFAYRVCFPDPGVYWYHPHIREDYAQEMGLYGNILVAPSGAGYWPPVHREVVLTLDDVLMEHGRIAPFSRTETSFAAMGRFGDVLLVGGETDLALSARLGEVVRFYLTDTANTRVFNVALPRARMKLVGGDSGRCEQEELVDSVIVAPSERVVVDVLFADPGELVLAHRTPQRTYPLATIDVSPEPAAPLDQRFDVLRANTEWVAERERLAEYVDAPPDKTLALVAEMDMDTPEGTVLYACPMHPDVVSDQPGYCPRCGMRLLATAAAGRFVCPMHPDVVSDQPGRCPRCGMKLLPAELAASAADAHDQAHGGERHDESHHAHPGHTHDPAPHDAPAGRARERHGHGEHGEAGGIEWEDDMVDINRRTTPTNMRWYLVDRATGAVNQAIDWEFRVGDQVKIRLVNEMDSDHPMHHPFHIHGAGRFVVLARDEAPERNLVWKDTVLVRTGETVDIVLDVTNPGVWMAHCHIAEHHESGMMFSFDVVAPDGR
ncbi:MAG TPA: multicopper oxidase domain-containing protein [Acidimicrobiales bacterium]